jgi:hypothetical protein
MRPYASSVSVQRLFAILVALSMLLSPAAARADELALAAFHPEMQLMEMGHCQMPPSGSSDHEKSTGKSCCISMCMAVAIQPSAPGTERFAQVAPASFGISSFHALSPGEIATPPPKFS